MDNLSKPIFCANHFGRWANYRHSLVALTGNNTGDNRCKISVFLRLALYTSGVAYQPTRGLPVNVRQSLAQPNLLQRHRSHSPSGHRPLWDILWHLYPSINKVFHLGRALQSMKHPDLRKNAVLSTSTMDGSVTERCLLQFISW